jgi:ABC-type polysaccharide/polyol phosphate export permease
VLPQELRAWLYLNPMTHLVQAYQAVVLHTPAGIRWSAIGALAAAALLLLCGSVRLVRRNLGAIYDEI